MVDILARASRVVASSELSSEEMVNIAFMLWASFSVFLMVQGAGLFYSGLSKRKSALTQAVLSLVTAATVEIQWFIWGYSLAFGHNASPFIGDLGFAGYSNLFQYTMDEGLVPELSNVLFQGALACLTAALLVGSIADRTRMLPIVVFIFAWSTLVYDPIACWSWNTKGWAEKMGYLDYAGGTPVHVTAGFSALAFCFMVGAKRETADQAVTYRPYSTLLVVIGTFFLWVGWFGFNSGAGLASTPRSVQALLNTQISASFGGFAWAIMDFRIAHKWSVVGFCSGVIAGLVAITPGAGYVPAWASVIFGILGGLLANVATKLKFFLHIDDSLDVFAVHGVGGIVGNLLTGLFTTQSIAGLDGITVIDGGWLNQNYIQLGYQVACTAAAAGYAFVVSCLILFCLQYIPGLYLRILPESEDLGIDLAEHDEFAFDYVELFPELPLSPGEIWAASNHTQNDNIQSASTKFVDTLTSGTPMSPTSNGDFNSDERNNNNIKTDSSISNDFVPLHNISKSADGRFMPYYENRREPVSDFQENSMFKSQGVSPLLAQDSSSMIRVHQPASGNDPRVFNQNGEAIEGVSTYRRIKGIQDQVELPAWKEQAHRYHFNNSSDLSTSATSNLSPTASPPAARDQSQVTSEINKPSGGPNFTPLIGRKLSFGSDIV